jgi:Carbohydrate family 9 binding domain-like
MISCALLLAGCAGTTSPTTPADIDAQRTYTAPRVDHDITVDGRASEPAWQDAPWSSLFVDIEGSAKPAPRHATRVKMLWSERYLFVYAEMIEPHVWATLTQKNSVIYHDNAFEIFLDPSGNGENYYEFEINALGTLWELTLEKPYRRGGKPRHGTNLPSLRSAVQVEGTLNDPRDLDRKWSCEIAIPLTELKQIGVPAVVPPEAGDVWRINFSRVQWRLDVVEGRYVRRPRGTDPASNWVWSPIGVIDMHVPEKWGTLVFGKKR